MKTIPYGKQNISEADIEQVVKALTSDWVTQGPKIPEFEKACAKFCGAEFGVAANSATSALHIACLALGLGPGDYLWTSPNTFVATANCGRFCGANVSFVDIDPKTYNMSIADLSDRLMVAKKQRKLPKIVVPVHFAGQSCDMEKIKHLSKEYGFKIIEDASHAIGGMYQGKKIGSCEYSDISVFSFHPVKIITTGEGGMLLTNQKEVYEKLQLLRSHGVMKEIEKMQNPSVGPWVYEQIELGFNYRMTDIQAALGLSQLSRIDDFIEKRQLIAFQYDNLLQDLPLVRPWQAPYSQSAYHLYPIVLNLEEINLSRKKVFEVLREEKIGVNVHYIPVHTQPYYQKLGFKWGDYFVAESYYHGAISLPIYPGLRDEEQVYIVNTLKKLLKH